MAQYFFLTNGSTLPNLRMEVINDGRNDFHKAYLALQAATVTFSMTNMETGVKKIANAKAYVIEKEDRRRSMVEHIHASSSVFFLLLVGWLRK